MSEIIDSFVTALDMIFSGDAEVWSITARTLAISLSATILAALISIPIACLIHFNNFRGKVALVTILQTFYALPTVLVGLLLYQFFSSSGPLGSLDILFTPTLMVIGQMVLIAPLMIGLTISALSGIGHEIRETTLTLGAGRIQMARTVLLETRYAVLSAVLIGFGRAISEVGVAIMIGGNIAGYTRILTTTIALETSQGNFELSMALGIILLVVALVVIITPSWIQFRSNRSLKR
ncbi:MAG: ABC transporter permease [Dehalococcoidia bacterium]|nr:MAG: ABC transporter permease [Dehalococcoidia bacterium]